MMSDRKQEIRTRPCPDCYICGAQGQLLYQGLEDRLFDAPGHWNMVKCSNPGCGLVWMDPMPIEEDIGKVYETYYTHEEEPPLRRFLRKLYVLFRVVFGFERQWRRVHMMYLDQVPPGRLLEIGCGDGQRLALFKSRGWIVEGQEVDQKAAGQVRDRFGIKVHSGKIEDLGLGEAEYDAVVMNHVVEHVHDPVGLLMECRRLLKPGGLLMAITPNIESLGHHIFRSCWLGLEQPRHLRLFSGKALRSCAERAGYLHIEIWATPVNAAGFYLGSHTIKTYGKYKMRSGNQSLGGLVRAAGFILGELLLSYRRPWIGEEIVLRAKK